MESMFAKLTLGRALVRSLGALLVTSALGACTVAPMEEEPMEQTESDLFAKTSTLWPMQNGVATIHVCWARPVLPRVYPVRELAPDMATVLPRLKAQVRTIVERQWNALTPLKFVGWNDCVNGGGDVSITPIDSTVKVPCSRVGGSCVEALGRPMRGRTVYLNVLFGEELRYSSRYQQRNPTRPQYDERLDISYWELPMYCMDEMRYAWAESNGLTRYRVDIDAPVHKARFEAIYARCLQATALHELGHVAGFAHEQYRPDDRAEQARCKNIMAARNMSEDFDYDKIVEQYRGETPLGPFDTESIMSYCRLDNSATLTWQDVQMTRAVYSGRALRPANGFGPF